MFRRCAMVLGVASFVLFARSAQADVFNMGGTRNPTTGTWAGLASLQLVTVGNPENLGDVRYSTKPFGRVDYAYSIGMYDVTAAQYCEFLNAVAANDSYGLYDARMDYDVNPTARGCNIKRSGSPGSYTYSVASDWANRPVNYVSWGDAARFSNWLQNGQPMGPQGSSTTEDGSYYLNGATTYDALMAVTRKAGARWVLPTENEWYKAAYYDPGKPGGAGYWDYPTRSNTVPSNEGADGYTDPGNHVNYSNGSSYTIGSPYWRTNVGEFENSASAYGTFDQGGNVAQWNETIVCVDVAGRGCRGGGFSATEYGLRAALCVYSSGVDREYRDTGFRVATVPVPEPGSLAMLLASAISLLAYAWRRGKAAA
jgi:formylglycine-generating enzyme